MIRISQMKLCIEHNEQDISKKVKKLLRVNDEDITNIEIIKKSLDARRDKGEMLFVYTVDVSLKDEKKISKKIYNNNIAQIKQSKYDFVPTGTKKMDNPPVIVGMGPCGLFAAYLLSLHGYNPIVLERGKCVEERKSDVDKYWETGILDTASNVQFGEGGAGTFSDGKLNTMVKDKNGRNKLVLEILSKFGANKEITYINKPHIGTDVLMNVVKNMRNEIIRLGGQVRFSAKVSDLIIEKNTIKGVIVNDTETIKTENVILAIGHSARDTFDMLYKKSVSMEAKNFAVGVRIQHPQEMIDNEMYGFSHKESNVLKASDYKLTGHAKNGRSVFSFCMCPGGYVVNASSEEGRIAVNGMSYSDRGSDNANSAIIVSVTKEDYQGDDPLAGVRFQKELEESAFKEGKGNVVVQLLGDYLNNQITTEFGEIKPCIKGKYSFGNINNIFKNEINEALKECIPSFEKTIKGFSRADAILAGVESRTSSPVRIHRDNETYESINVMGLYPAGEGAGYAGGITSAAMDGVRMFEAISSKYLS